MNKNTIKNLVKLEDERVRNIGKIAIEKDIPFKTAEKLFSDNLRIFAIAKLAEATGHTYKEAEALYEQTVAYTKKLIEADKISDASEDLGLCAEDCESYQAD